MTRLVQIMLGIVLILALLMATLFAVSPRYKESRASLVNSFANMAGTSSVAAQEEPSASAEALPLQSCPKTEVVDNTALINELRGEIAKLQEQVANTCTAKLAETPLAPEPPPAPEPGAPPKPKPKPAKAKEAAARPITFYFSGNREGEGELVRDWFTLGESDKGANLHVLQFMANSNRATEANCREGERKVDLKVKLDYGEGNVVDGVLPVCRSRGGKLSRHPAGDCGEVKTYRLHRITFSTACSHSTSYKHGAGVVYLY